ncbi:PQQ-dependent sugar dehydrogenase [Bordetella holmesii]|uniref:Soluble aldose sugar dehydrogenase YliI n=2 Tax=Bordetella holmesii TaxID=35814 RepID=A0A158M8V1_9BORD|nr:PQQ-dependent sugar dehydrogenase [Bordetella holmesii]AHV91841.1 glucose / Sorbosone dehydrogenase family protein [Bordetella holmesii ATCC 51541]AIT28218.1 glucose / Sorbosone dehydrogenase family protein [Bordetella holmesii 44057]EWM41003.1 glucose / Sorbosone dehydrogenase family protein [Bordetella holmesii 35009]EWM43120.1 glucose / Sorbosone dehydrogenase family protein [Bordetella holmesii 41130]EWM44896.1 glucose / Sorbosone dehydrogenase family protein [Bordetella holmesii 70147]
MSCHRFLWLSVVVGTFSLGAAHASTSLTPTAANVRVTEVARGLEHPWALAFLPDGSALITERPGVLRQLRAGKLSEPIKGVPQVYAQGQGGLLDVALSPGFAQDRLVYLAFSQAGDGKSGTAVGRGRLSEDGMTLGDFTVIFRQLPKLSTGHHYGSRLAFDKNGHLFVALGENNQRPTAQDLTKLQGKVVRLNLDGAVPDDNPFVTDKQARPEIWSYGHRNPQGLAVNPWTGALWEHEHGPRGGDELNVIERGANYGWPLATHGINYSGLRIPEAAGTDLDGGAAPKYWWAKSPAISGMAFYDAPTYPQWRRSLFIGALADQSLIRLTLDGDNVVAEERMLKDLGARIRDVRVGPDGAVYVLTDAAQGSLLRLTPAEQP